MVGDYLQKQIIKGNAEHVVLNAFDVTWNYNLGRNKDCIIEKIQIQPLVSDFYLNLPDRESATDLENAINNYLSDSINTLRIYDGRSQQNYTFKLNYNISTIRLVDNNQDPRNIFLATAKPIEIDVFWKFTGENIVVELFTAEDLFSGSVPTYGSNPAASRTKANNPVGSNDPYLIDRSNVGYPATLNNLGRLTPVDVLQNRLIEAIVPAQGDDQVGNKFPIKTTGSNFFDQSYPIISLGAVLYEPGKLADNGSC